MDKPKGITMAVPAGFTPPEGTGEGDSFDAVASLTMLGGSLILTSLDGIPVASAKSEAPKEDKSEPMEDSEDFESAIEKGMA